MKGASFIATQFPLNIASLAAVLLKEGHDVRIWDLDVERFNEMELEAALLEFSPLITGISCYTPTIMRGHDIAGIVKRCLPASRTIVGGPHVSALPAQTLEEFGRFDIGVMGEGEETILELAQVLSDGGDLKEIRGIAYRKDGKVVINRRRDPVKELDGMPFPARELLKMPLYRGQSHRGFSRGFLNITEIMTSRGCPNRCIFCASDIVMGGGVRFRSAGSVKREIGECVERYGFNHFTVSDDTFTLKEERLYEICDEFARRRVTWNCNARVWPVSRKMLRRMKESGCEGITFGVESGSPRMLELVKKNVSVSQIEDAFRWSREAGIKLIEADIIIGSHPSETRGDIEMTRRLLKRISPDIIMVSVIVPYPGTEVYEIMKKRSLLFQDKRWDSFVLFGKEPSWKTDNFSPAELMKLQKEILLSFYFNPLYILRAVGKIKSSKEFSYWFRGGIDFLSASFRKPHQEV